MGEGDRGERKGVQGEERECVRRRKRETEMLREEEEEKN